MAEVVAHEETVRNTITTTVRLLDVSVLTAIIETLKALLQRGGTRCFIINCKWLITRTENNHYL